MAKILASGSGDRMVKLWNLATGKLLSSLRGHTGGVYTVAWSPDGKTLASGSDDRTVSFGVPLQARNAPRGRNGFHNTLQSAQAVSSPAPDFRPCSNWADEEAKTSSIT